MSVKSQKELYDECSEIFEKSYSVRSLSNESLSGYDENEALAIELLNRLSPAVLSKLRKKFVYTTIKDDDDIESKVEATLAAAAAAEGIEFRARAPRAGRGWALDVHTFVAALHHIFEGPKYTTHAQKLFSLLDPFGTGRIWWEDLLDELVKIGARKTRSRVEVWEAITPQHIEMKKLAHCKRETLVALVSVQSERGFCYAAVSRGGRVGLYTGALGLRPVLSYGILGAEGRRRVRNTWITDAVYMADSKCLVVSASNRTLTFVDAATLVHSLLYVIVSLPNIPTSLAYEASESKGDSSELVWGDDRGDLTSMTFLQPRMMLLHKTHADKSNTYYWTDLTSKNFEPYLRIRRWKKLVSRLVRRVALCRPLSSVMVCSHDASAALIIKHRPGLLDDYVFKVVRGVSCFHICGTSRILVTGGPDGIIRVWEPARPTPLAQLQRPARVPIKDVAIVSDREIILSFTKNCTLDVWDIYEETLLQTIKLNFPFLGVLGKRVEFGAYCIYPGPPRKKHTEVSQNAKGKLLSKIDLDLNLETETLQESETEEIEIPTEPEYWEKDSGLKDDPEYIRWDKPDFIVSCCDWLCQITFPDSKELLAAASPVPPPTRSQHVLMPQNLPMPSVSKSFMDSMEAETMETTPISQAPAELASWQNNHRENNVDLPSLTPSRKFENLDELLKKAGLEGILEKDFVLMKGLKHDLNQRLFKMQELTEQMKTAVSLRAPYLGLRLHDAEPLPDLPDVEEAYRHVLRLFPSTSSVGSSPRTPRTPHSPRSFSSLYTKRT